MTNEAIVKVLKSTFLFNSLDEAEIIKLLKNNTFKISNYDKDEVIFLCDTPCNELNIILDGKINLEQNDASGNTLTLASLHSSNMFGENLLFGANNIYPVDVISKSKSTIISVKKSDVSNLLKVNFDFTLSFLGLLSNKAQLLNKKIRQVSLQSLREMIIEFLLLEKEKQSSNTIRLNMTKQALADSLGVQRPSLSRELIKMKNEGLIDFDRKQIKILKLDAY
ncbi:Crp/Fnr family transcriptional regulator [Clostridium chrysemydis]|uniref:Crp/Fnr family transcriptional regulator n=1 Tax=Clostridium chrysemydis TaxID=2665504 RepID=UPI0018843BE4|nr:Crp/Fnr family transcriptional regulator [Clostridium chrysemydis]